jgi:hypothetical protein
MLSNEQDLLPRILSIGTCRVLRVKQVGIAFFVENDVGHIDEAGMRHEDWKVVAISKGQDAYKESHQFLAQANVQVLQQIKKDLAARGRGVGAGV